MKRRVFDLLALVFLALCAATLAIWHRSCFSATDKGYFFSRSTFVQLAVVDGRVVFTWAHGDVAYWAAPWKIHAGLGAIHYPKAGGGTHGVQLPLNFYYSGPWQLWANYPTKSPKLHLIAGYDAGISCGLLFTIMLALALLSKLMGRKRVIPRTCAICGYDLRASRGRCPECGEVPVNAERLAALSKRSRLLDVRFHMR